MSRGGVLLQPRALFPAGLHFQPRPSQAKPSQAQGNLRDTPLVPEARWRIVTKSKLVGIVCISLQIRCLEYDCRG